METARPVAVRLTERDSHREYDSWRQVAGFFDGDGAVYISVRKFVLKVRVAFYDSWRPQLETIKKFLDSRGIKTPPLRLQRKEKGDLWNLTISNPPQIRTVIRNLLPFSCKKRADLLVALDYLEDRLTARDAIEKLNDSVENKRRSGFIRKFDVPMTRSQGILLGRRQGAKAGADAATIHVPPSVQEKIQSDRRQGSTLTELQARYGYGVRVIRRVIRSSKRSA